MEINSDICPSWFACTSSSISAWRNGPVISTVATYHTLTSWMAHESITDLIDTVGELMFSFLCNIFCIVYWNRHGLLFGRFFIFCNNSSIISSPIHRNVMILQLRNSYWHEPMCISQEVHMESLSQSINKQFSKIFICIPIDTIINIR